MSPQRRKPTRLTKAQQLAQAALDREARKAGKRGRAVERTRFQRELAGDVDIVALSQAFAAAVDHVAEEAAGAEEAARAEGAPHADGDPARREAAPMAFPGAAAGRWVPIGPSAVRRGQAMDRPRVSGRIRDLQVNDTGQRAYAASAKGGVWYTEDAGATWAPVGGWAEVRRSAGGSVNAQTCGCLLVSFGAISALDVVLVGTGETTPWQLATGEASQGGIGVLAALGPVTAGAGGAPWDRDTGLTQLEGRGIFRLARSPASRPWSDAGADQDVLVAATSRGAFIGTRSALPAVGGANPLPARSGYTWAPWAALDAFVGSTPVVTDLLWLPGGRIVVAFYRTAVNGALLPGGVVVANALAGPFQWVTNLQTPPTHVGRLSLARGPANRVYVLGELQPPPIGAVAQPAVPTLWRIADVTTNPPVAMAVPGVPPGIWGGQRDYDQAIAVDDDGGTDRVYLGGSVAMPRPNTQWGASLWAFQVSPAPALVPVPNVSRAGGIPAGGDGADQAGLIGNNVHGDVHSIRLVRPAAGQQHVWVTSDGGVFRSTQAGRVNTFASCATGLAALEPIFVASHPTSSHFLLTGFQDNGAQVRIGDTLWEETFVGDGGGVAFHPVHSHIVVAQWTQATWQGQPASEYIDPIQRFSGGPGDLTNDRENGLARFYSGAATVRASASVGRVALGTERVWLTDNLGGAAGMTWRVLPIVPPAPPPRVAAAATDPRSGGGDLPAQQAVGVPPGFGSVVALDWASPTVLLAAYSGGIVRYTEAPAGRWLDEQWPLTAATVAIPANATLTDIAAEPGTSNFYVTTTGDGTDPTVETLWYFDNAVAGGTFQPTGLRRMLDVPAPPAVAVTQGPLDPAYAVVVDPASPMVVYVGTATGVWQGTRTPGTMPLAWSPYANGLPQATVQDLDIWRDPGGAVSPRLLRAGVQSRGVWEVDLSAAAKRETYVRIHARDDRRRLPTPLANPRRGVAAPPEAVHASPDIAVRPQWPVAAPPRFLAAPLITPGNAPRYQTWTFQTALRWRYPAVVADGTFSEAFGDIVAMERSRLGLANATARIDQALWNAVVGSAAVAGSGIRLDANGAVSAAAGDPLAVYRAPWQTADSPQTRTAAATELDLLDLVQPVQEAGGVWTVFREPTTVDVLLHHRDARAVAANRSWGLLLWQSRQTSAELLNLALPDLVALTTAAVAGVALPAVGTWNVATLGGGAALHPLGVALDARLPRAVSFDVNLSGVTAGHRVLFLAIVGSRDDDVQPVEAPTGAPATVRDLVLGWPHAACRIVRVVARP